MSIEPEGYNVERLRTDAPNPVLERVKTPAILLIIVAILNLLGGVYFLLTSYGTAHLPDELWAQKWNEQDLEVRQNLEKMGVTSESMRDLVVTVAAIWGGVALLAALLTLWGAVRMLRLRTYGLAVFGSVLAALPFISPSGCCLLGEVAGIWALIVLFNTEVRSAFR